MLHFALPDPVPAEGEERVLVLAAEADAGDAAAVGHGQDDLRGAIVGADLDAAARGDELAAFERVAHGLRTRVVIPIRDVEMEKPLLVRERAVVIDLVGIDPLRVTFGDGQQPLIGAIRSCRWRISHRNPPASFCRP